MSGSKKSHKNRDKRLRDRKGYITFGDFIAFNFLILLLGNETLISI